MSQAVNAICGDLGMLRRIDERPNHAKLCQRIAADGQIEHNFDVFVRICGRIRDTGVGSVQPVAQSRRTLPGG